MLIQRSDRPRLLLPVDAHETKGARQRRASDFQFVAAGLEATITLSAEVTIVIEVSIDSNFAGTVASFHDSVSWRVGTPAGRRKVATSLEALIAATTTHPALDPVPGVLLASLTRTIAAQLGAGPERPDDGWLHPVALRRVIETVEDCLAHPTSAGEMARLAGLGPSAFHRAFRGSTGRTPVDYLQERQVVHARALLTSGAWDVAEVARRCGFPDAARLAAVLKERTGTTPALLKRRSAARRSESNEWPGT